jgi:transposase
LNKFPLALPGFEIQQITRRETLLIMTGRATNLTTACPCCQQVSSRVHSYYTRSPQDLPISGQEVQFVLEVRRFRCQNPSCRQKTFAERLPVLPVRARQTARLGSVLDAIAVALSGQAGSRLSEDLAMPVSPDTLLRRAKRAMPTSRPTPKVLGIDDFGATRIVVCVAVRTLERRILPGVLPPSALPS